MSKTPPDRKMTYDLANLLRGFVKTNINQSHELDISSAKYAEARHRTGALLHILAKQGGISVDEETETFLQNSYRHAGLFIARQQQARVLLGTVLNGSNIPFVEFKGRGLSEQLYEDPAGRFSKDIDILVHNKDQDRALQALFETGFLKSVNGKIFNRRKAALAMWSRKDASLYDPKFGQQIELHRRLFSAEPQGLTQDFLTSVLTDGTPKISNSFYILYLILHGAHAHWTSLRRILDIPVLLNKVPAEKALEVFDLAQKYHSISAVSASIRFMYAIFPDCTDDIWLNLANKCQTAKSINLEKFYDRVFFSPPFSVRRVGFPVPEWYIYDGGINFVREAPKRVMRVIANRI